MSKSARGRCSSKPNREKWLELTAHAAATTIMITRQKIIRSGAVLAALPLAARSNATAADSYEAAVKKIRQPISGPSLSDLALRKELVRLSALAPSSHNTQCWKFRIEQNGISILPDLNRRTLVLDPDDHYLFVSLGCALENLAQASLAFGLKSEAKFDKSTNSLAVALEPTMALASPLYQAIIARQCTRNVYDGKPLSSPELKLLESAGACNGGGVVLITAKPDIEQIVGLALQGNASQLNEAAFIKEFKQWIRFSAGEAVKTGDGLYSITSGNPSVPRWLGSRMFDVLVSAESENKKYAEQIRSSSGIAVFVSDADDKTHWIEAGRCYERFALQATSMGIRNAVMNGLADVPEMRQQLAGILGLKGGRVDMVVRFGHGPLMPSSLRRPMADILV